MAKKKITLTFPQELIKEPVIFRVAKQFDLVPNIRRAKITETVGEVTLELRGSEENLERGIKHLEQLGVKVEPVVGDLVE
ncbi:MAG: NIL domain-containing protein [Candidatus Aerophobetes bacterium]